MNRLVFLMLYWTVANTDDPSSVYKRTDVTTHYDFTKLATTSHYSFHESGSSEINCDSDPSCFYCLSQVEWIGGIVSLAFNIFLTGIVIILAPWLSYARQKRNSFDSPCELKLSSYTANGDNNSVEANRKASNAYCTSRVFSELHSEKASQLYDDVSREVDLYLTPMKKKAKLPEEHKNYIVISGGDEVENVYINEE